MMKEMKHFSDDLLTDTFIFDPSFKMEEHLLRSKIKREKIIKFDKVKNEKQNLNFRFLRKKLLKFIFVAQHINNFLSFL